MKILIFDRGFDDAILYGTKRMTIRQTCRVSPGDVISLRAWSGRPTVSRVEISMRWMWVAQQNNTLSGIITSFLCRLWSCSGIKNVIECICYTRYGISVMNNKKPKATSGIAMPLSVQVKGMRKAAGLTQAAMAKRTGVGAGVADPGKSQ